jgi:hypothetical protein
MNDVIAFSPMISTINAFPSTVGIDQISNGIYDIIKPKDPQQSIEAEFSFRVKNIDPQVREIQNKRFRFLLRLYELRDRETLRGLQAIGDELGFDKSTLNEISKYYIDNYFIEYPSIGCVEITVWGMDYVEELIKDSIDVQNVRANRDKVLRRLYDVRTQTQRLDMWGLGEELGFSSQKVTFDIMYYLNVKGLIDWHYSFVCITTEGIDYVENYLF